MSSLLGFNRDKMNHASTREVGNGIVAIADVVQKMPKHIRVLAAAGFLMLLVEHMRIEPQDVMAALGNIRDEADRTGRVEFTAIKAYLKDDLAA